MEDEEAVAFRKRIESAVATVQAWDADPDLLAECRAQIPLDRLRRDENNAADWSRPEDAALSPSHRFVQRLARHFQDKMTWVNQPPCATCGGATTLQGVRGPVSERERQGGAARVEVYNCTADDKNQPHCATTTTTFPRYNAVRTLLETHAGRCGEYANLFGLYCRAVGLETRYVLDFTDHVWTEVRLIDDDDRWIMVDSCEGVIDENSMYEAGWGKKLSYCIAVGRDHAVDVTPRYTRQWHRDEFQARRRGVLGSGEAAGDAVLQQINQSLMQSCLSPKERTRLERRLAREQASLQRERHVRIWEHQYGRGRISGSLAWKVSRREDGTTSNNKESGSENDKKHPDTVPSHFYIETFYPLRDNLSIVLQPHPETRHRAVLVNGVACAVGALDSLSVVVLDETYLGCILQSRSFLSLPDFAEFVASLPAQRIVAVVGKLAEADISSKTSTISKLKELGGFDPAIVKDGILCVGQVLAQPDWAHCCTFQDAPKGFKVEGIVGKDSSCSNRKCRLRTAAGVRPAAVVARLPESVMPLQTQHLAGHEQKRTAFLSFLGTATDCGKQCCYGYTSKPGAPVYLLGETAYPFTRVESSQSNNDDEPWSSFLLLPDILVPDDDSGIKDVAPSLVPQYEAPLEADFFVRSLGPNLLRGAQTIPTVDALRNTRLVGLYMSAHWCGPCRSFTPVLAEMYELLKDAFPAHGLEIVFVSSDRDVNSFRQYYASMPWLAIPFETLGFYKQLLSATYNVRGIPSLVILDSLSGQVVVPNTETRQQVMQACSRGDESIKSMFQTFLDRCPAESKQMLEMLEMSCKDAAGDSNEEVYGDSTVLRSHLLRKESKEKKDRMNSLVAQLVEDGMEIDEATEAAQAVEDVSADEDPQEGPLQLEAGPWNGVFTRTLLGEKDASQLDRSPTEWAARVSEDAGRDQLVNVLSTSLKYLNNCRKAPWSTAFRSFRLSFKAADRITRVLGGLQLLQSLGFTVHGTTEDFVASIPIYADLDAMHGATEELLEQYKTSS